MKLLVVESPTKSHKIYGLLQILFPTEEWQTVASLGHICDLPAEELAVDETTLEAIAWTKTPRQKKAVALILSHAKKAEAIYVGTDPDREGEAIGWWIAYELRKAKVKVPVHRVTFHEITSKALKEAIENPTVLNEFLVEAQKARRILDRLIGYKITSVLHSKLSTSRYSIGRVQAPALHFLSVRERERNQHVPSARWKLLAFLTGGFQATSDWYSSEANALEIYAQKWEKKAVAISKEQKEIKAPPPFTTAKLLQEACPRLKCSADEVMRAAQQLFEEGNITYHRTDSIRLDWGFINRAREYISYSAPDALSARPRNFPSEGAHEAIRPTDPSKLPSKLVNVTSRAQELYKLIWARSLATQGSPAIMEYLQLGFGTKGDPVVWITGSKFIDPGWHAAAAYYLKPNLQEIPEDVEIQERKISKSWTEPAKRYTEALLIHKLEEEEIGRPSTYASILPTLVGKSYVYQAGFSIQSTMKGLFVSAYLESAFPELADPSFTAIMEHKLDLIEQGEIDRYTALREIWLPLTKRMEEASSPSTAAICTKGHPLIVIAGNQGPYLYCSTCDKMHGIDIKDQTITLFQPSSYIGQCSKCNAEKLQTAQSKYGRYVWCKECNQVQ